MSVYSALYSDFRPYTATFYTAKYTANCSKSLPVGRSAARPEMSEHHRHLRSSPSTSCPRSSYTGRLRRARLGLAPALQDISEESVFSAFHTHLKCSPRLPVKVLEICNSRVLLLDSGEKRIHLGRLGRKRIARCLCLCERVICPLLRSCCLSGKRVASSLCLSESPRVSSSRYVSTGR